MRPLVIITTKLPPEVCGIGAYSLQLHEHWPEKDRAVTFVTAREAAEKLPDISEADVLLHYAGRAFHGYGFPFWLPRAVRKAARLIVFFHELPAELPLTSARGVAEALARSVARRLARIADVLVTNTEHQAAKLRRWSGRDVRVIPVGSNIPRVATDAARTESEAVVFGLPFGRRQTLQLFASDIAEWHRTGKLTKLHIIGPPDPEEPRLSCEVVRHGVLAPDAVSRVLSSVGFALSHVTPETWTKSGSFMAFAGHGLAVKTKTPLPYTGDLRAWYENNAAWEITAPKLAELLR